MTNAFCFQEVGGAQLADEICVTLAQQGAKSNHSSLVAQCCFSDCSLKRSPICMFHGMKSVMGYLKSLNLFFMRI